MKPIKILLMLVIIPGFVYTQTLKTGVAYAWIPDLQVNGFKIGNQFSFPGPRINLDIGIDFILGRGNPNVVYSDSMNYNLDLSTGNNPDWYTKGLIPLTVSITQFQASMGISRRFSTGASDLSLGVGGYFSRTSSHFLIGPFKEADVYRAMVNLSNGDMIVYDSTKWDVVFPVNIRYLNIGMYFAAEWLLLKDKRTPVGLELKYYAGLTRKHIVTFGVNFHLPM